MNILHTLVGLCLILTSMASPGYADTTTIYRWVDSAGKTHFSDIVPAEFRRVANPVSVRTLEPSELQSQRATERATQNKIQAAKIDPGVQQNNDAGVTAAPVQYKRPRYQPTQDTDCETWLALFQESSECFGPYNVVGGGIKLEAFEHCTQVLSPPQRCQRQLR